jgi:hypothetical protein
VVRLLEPHVEQFIVLASEDRAIFQASPDKLPVIAIHVL